MKRINRETTILICADLNTAFNEENQVTWEVRSALVGRNQAPGSTFGYDLQDISNLSSLKLVLQTSFGKKELVLPEKIYTRLINYFREKKHLLQDFDCASFVFFLYDMPFDDRTIWPQIWHFDKIEEEKNVQAGDIVLVCARDADELVVKHMAIYLSDGLYISKFGDKGNIIFATLDEMKKGFLGTEVHRITLKTQDMKRQNKNKKI